MAGEQEGFYFESVIILIMLAFLVLIFLKFWEKRNKLTLTLFFVYIFQTLAVIFSWLTKFFELYIFPNKTWGPEDLGYFWIIRIYQFRVSMLFMSISIYLIYLFEVKAFALNHPPWKKWGVVILGVLVSTFCFLVYFEDMGIFDIIAFFLIVVYMLVVYLPFMIRSFTLAKSVDNKIAERSFYALGISAICYILVFTNFLIDRIFVVVTNEGYTLFYFLAWIFGIISIASAFFGYIRPGKKN